MRVFFICGEAYPESPWWRGWAADNFSVRLLPATGISSDQAASFAHRPNVRHIDWNSLDEGKRRELKSFGYKNGKPPTHFRHEVGEALQPVNWWRPPVLINWGLPLHQLRAIGPSRTCTPRHRRPSS
jgi:hypothetical protein